MLVHMAFQRQCSPQAGLAGLCRCRKGLSTCGHLEIRSQHFALAVLFETYQRQLDFQIFEAARFPCIAAIFFQIRCLMEEKIV